MKKKRARKPEFAPRWTTDDEVKMLEGRVRELVEEVNLRDRLLEKASQLMGDGMRALRHRGLPK